jgi:PKD domain protein
MYIPYRLIAVLLVIALLSSCLREESVPIASAFSIEVAEDKTTPVQVQLKNESYGADEYEWTFEGGSPASSREKRPGTVTFTEPGEHKIRLRVRNSVEEKVSEQTLRVDSALSLNFDYQIAINDIAPAVVTLRNLSKGGSHYEWSFEGGEPSSSVAQYPSAVTFKDGGEHKIHLRVFNGSRYEELSKTVTLQAPMRADFSYTPSAVDQDWEAPLTLRTQNITTGGLTYRWLCEGATVEHPDAVATSIRFERAGRYHLTLLARNGKEEQRINKIITIKPNRGIIEQQNLKFGINEAKNTIGCFYSSYTGGVVTSKRIAEEQLGSKIDFGFFALNSSFSYCYFFAPNQAVSSSFPLIPRAQEASFVHYPSDYGSTITDADFKSFRQAKDFDRFKQWSEPRPRHFDKGSLPHFVLFRTADGRRGVIRVKRYVHAGTTSYILADIKIEKRPNE